MKITSKPKPDFPIQERGLWQYILENAEDGLFHQPQQMIADNLGVSRAFVNKWAKVLVAHKRISVYEPAVNGQAATYKVPCHVGDTPVTQVTPLSRMTGKPTTIITVDNVRTVKDIPVDSIGICKQSPVTPPVTYVTPAPQRCPCCQKATGTAEFSGCCDDGCERMWQAIQEEATEGEAI